MSEEKAKNVESDRKHIHVIYECPELEYVQSDDWSKVLASMPSATASQIGTFSTKKTSFCVSYLDSKAHTSESGMMFIEILLVLFYN